MKIRKAFTIFELLAVVTLLSVLLALLLPALTRAREIGRNVRCVSNNRQIMVAMRLYTVDARGVYPPSDPKFPISSSYWCVPLDKRYLYERDPASNPNALYSEVWDCPSNPSPRDAAGIANGSWCSYMFNKWATPLGGSPPYDYYKINKIKSASDTFFILERWLGWNAPVTMGDGWFSCMYGGLIDKDTGDATPQNTPHTVSTNVGFGDGHVESLARDHEAFYQFPGAPIFGPYDVDVINKYWDPTL